MRGVRVSRPADRDLNHIWYYVARESGNVEIADRLIESISQAFALFVKTPEAGKKRDEIAPGVRSFPVGNYIIYYSMTERYVVISRVLHGMRDQASAYSKRQV